MISRIRNLTLFLTASFACAPALFGQANLQVSVIANGSLNGVLPGGSVALVSNGIGQAVQATAVVRYAGTTSAVISSITLTNASEMSLLLIPTLPATLTPGGSTSFTFQYLPSS